jgi:predicted RNA-binding protein YlqC (UPF0109 family)
MKEFVAYLARSLADRPRDVSVTEKPGARETLLELTVADEDLNRLIGRQGRIIKAMRALLTAASARRGRRYFLKIEGALAAAGAPADDGPAVPGSGDGEDGDGDG